MGDRRSFLYYYDDLIDNISFEINGQMIGLLPKFRGGNGDSPLDHLRDFLHVCNKLKTKYVDEEEFMVTMLPISLVSDAKTWIFSLYVDSRFTWKQMQQLFVNKYSVKQHPQETTYNYLQRFGLRNVGPYHVVTEDVRIISFLEGMTLHEREMMDALAGGSILDCYPKDAWDLILRRAVDSRVAEISKANAERQSSPQTSPTELIAQPVEEQFVQPVTHPVVEKILEVVRVEECCKDEESTSPPTPIILDVITLSHLTDKEEEIRENTPKIGQSEERVTEQEIAHPLEQPVEQLLEQLVEQPLELPVEQPLELPVEQPLELPVEQPLEQQPVPQSTAQSEEQTEVQVQTQVLAQPEAQAEAQVSAQLEVRRESEPDPNTTMEQGIILYTPNLLLVPNFILSSQIQEDSKKMSNEEKIRRPLDKVTTQGSLVHICKQNSTYKRSLDEVRMNQKTYKKVKRMTMDEEVSLFFVPLQRRHTSFGWKPGWNLCRSATNNKATKNMSQCWKKFDGVHPWAPNI